MACQSTHRIFLALVMTAVSGFVGCTSATTMVWEAAKKLHEDRTTDTQFTDTKISASVMSALAEKDVGLFLDVNADVWDTRVLLTGTVTDPAMRQEVVRQVRGDKRIQKIYNEIQIVSKAEQQERRPQNSNSEGVKIEAVASDFWIETKVAAKLVTAKDVTSVNYRWRSVRKTLYVIGRAHSKQELTQVLTLMRGTEGVRRVKSFVEIKPDIVG